MVQDNQALRSCVEHLLELEEIGLDIETSKLLPGNEVYQPGLDPYLSRIVMVQIGTIDHVYVIDARKVDLTLLKPVLESNTILKIGHNLQFEYKHFRKLGIKLVNIWDTFVVEKVLYNGLKLKYSLAALAERYLGIQAPKELDLFTEEDEDDSVYLDKSTRLQFINIGDRPFTDTQIEYGKNDIIYPLEIKAIQEKGRVLHNGEIYCPLKGFRLENATVPALADMSYNGLGFHKEKWLSILESQKVKYYKRLEVLNNWVINNVPKFTNPPSLFEGATCKVEWTSPQQVVKLFKYLGICPKEFSKSTQRVEDTVSAKALLKTMEVSLQDLYSKDKDKEISSLEDFKLAYLLFKKSQMCTTTFGEDWLRYIHPVTGRVHSNFNQYMHTSRLSSNNPNIQNLPNGEYRDCFVDVNFTSADFSSQEIRILADISGSQVLQDFFVVGNPDYGDDFHSFSASKMIKSRTGQEVKVSKETHPKERNAAKTLIFGISYGATSYSIQYKLNVTEPEAQKFIDNFIDGFPGLRENFKQRQDFAIKHGYIILDDATDRRYFFPEYQEMLEAQRDDPRKYGRIKGILSRRALNYGIQGLAAGMTKLALIYAYKKGLTLISCIHDEICAITDEGHILEECMIEAGKFFCKVPMAATAITGNKWIH